MIRNQREHHVTVVTRPACGTDLRRFILLLLAAGVLDTGASFAQQLAPEPIDRPGAARPALPPFAPAGEPPSILPRIAPFESDEPRLSEQLRVFVKRIRVTGATAIGAEELAAVVRPYEDRTATSEELQELRQKLTLLYVNRGYVNSGAVLPDQEVRDGVIEYRIVEGRLNEVVVTGNARLRADYVSGRIFLGAGPPLNLNELQRQLQLLQQGGLLERVNAELVPGVAPGESTLRVAVEEARPYQVVVSAGNNRSPSVGSNRGEVAFGHRNLTGRGDALGIRYGLIPSTSKQDWSLDYSLPINPYDTTVFLRSNFSESIVIETPFHLLDIQSKARTKAVGVSHPLLQTPNQTFALSLAREWRTSQSFLLGQPFSFAPGIPDGRSAERVWRFAQDWLRRADDEVIAFRSTFSHGHTNATDKVAGIGPERTFTSWLGQFQWARRFPGNGSQLLFRADLQYTGDALLTLEKFSLGGVNSVRGFRESQFLRDKGYVLSLEYRLPVMTSESGETRLQLAPFIDHGGGWNADATPDSPRSLTGAGVGLLWTPHKQWQAQLYLARGSRKIPQTERSWQDRGVHFLAAFQFF